VIRVHECIQEERLARLEANSENHGKILNKLDEKTDKILWFVLGFFGTGIVTLIGILANLVF
jgi:hypothetical protein